MNNIKFLLSDEKFEMIVTNEEKVKNYAFDKEEDYKEIVKIITDPAILDNQKYTIDKNGLDIEDKRAKLISDYFSKIDNI